MVELIKKPRNIYYSEIGQSLPVKFTFVNKKNKALYEEVTVPFVCRDFFTDMLLSYETGKKSSIYGFNYSYEKTPFDLDKTRILVVFPTEEAKDIFIYNYALLQDIEQDNLINFTEGNEVDNLSLILEGDNYWQSKAYLLSLYTGLIRWLSIQKYQDEAKFISIVAKSATTDGSHIRNYAAEGFLINFLKDIRKMDQFDYGIIGSNSSKIGEIHDTSGILGVWYSSVSKYHPHIKELYS